MAVLLAHTAWLVFSNEAQALNSGDSNRQADRQFLIDLDNEIDTVKIEDATIKRLEKMVLQDPSMPVSRYLLGRLFERQGFENLAIEQYEAALEANREFYPAVFSLFSLGLRLRDPEILEPNLKQCLLMSRNDGQRLLRIGMTLERYGRLKDAERIYETAYRAPQRALGVGASLAELRIVQGRFAEALEAVQYDLRRSDTDARANVVKGKILLAMGKSNQAAQSYLKAYRTSACQDDAAYLAARELLRENYCDQALAPALTALICRAAKKDVLEKAKDVLLSVMKKVDDHTAAMAVEQCAMELPNPSYVRFFRFAMGDIYDRLGRPYRAVDQYKKGVQAAVDPDFENNEILSRGLFRWGLDERLWFRDYDRALALFEKARRLSPEDEEIKSNCEILKRRMQVYKNDVAAHMKDAIWKLWMSLWMKPPVLLP